MHILVMDFQILLSPAEDFQGDIVLALSVHPSSFRPAGYGQQKVDQRRIVKSLASYLLTKWESCQLLAKSEESTGYGTQILKRLTIFEMT